jgi:hypothetical protein
MMSSEANVAAIEYQQNGVTKVAIGQSEWNGPHSEESVWGQLHHDGVQPEDITRVYTERAPCTLPAHECGRWIGQVMPNAEVYHSFEYGSTSESRAAGDQALRDALRQIRGEGQ